MIIFKIPLAHFEILCYKFYLLCDHICIMFSLCIGTTWFIFIAILVLSLYEVLLSSNFAFHIQMRQFSWMAIRDLLSVVTVTCYKIWPLYVLLLSLRAIDWFTKASCSNSVLSRVLRVFSSQSITVTFKCVSCLRLTGLYLRHFLCRSRCFCLPGICSVSFWMQLSASFFFCSLF